MDSKLPRTWQGQVEDWAIEWIDDAAKRIAAGVDANPGRDFYPADLARLVYARAEALFAERQRRYFDGGSSDDR